MEVAAKFRDRYNLAVNMPIDLPGHLAEVLFRDNEGLGSQNLARSDSAKGQTILSRRCPISFAG